MNHRGGTGLLLVIVLGLPHCAAERCVEDIRAQVIHQHVELSIGSSSIEAELADDEVERERGWMHRQCGRQALLLVPDDQPQPLPIWGCGLTTAVDLYLIRAQTVVEVVRGLAPCERPCDECPLVGEHTEVDAVLETPAGQLDEPLGAIVQGLP